MGLNERIELYRQIEVLRQRPLLVYITSQRSGASGNMAADVIPEFVDQLQKITVESDKIDLYIESSGGDALVAWRVMSLIREKYKDVSALIPSEAFSAATLLSLGCNEILMGRYGCLGPIDPQIMIKNDDGTTKRVAYQDILSYLDFIKDEADLQEESSVASAFKILSEHVDPLILGGSRRASSLSVTMGEKLLQTHMVNEEEKQKASDIAKDLNESFFSHGHALSRSEAKGIGLKIVNPDPDIERLMWAVHEDAEIELRRREPFNPIETFLENPDAQMYLRSPPPLNIPPQIPQQVVMQLIQNHFNQQVQATVPDVTVDLTFAFVESQRHASVCQGQLKILLSRTVDLKFIANTVPLKMAWEKREIQNPDE